MIKYKEIDQFRHAIKKVTEKVRFVGLDENGKAIFDNSKELPVLTFKGTVKLHGTNAGVTFDNGEIYAQSRSNVITPQKDNAGFATFVHKNLDWFEGLFLNVQKTFLPDANETITIFGEWVGKGIQKGVAISEIEKSFFVFGLKLGNSWLDLSWVDEDCERRIFNIQKYKTYEIEIDFNKPEEAQNKMIQMVEEVENECPVAKQFGVSGIGEGIVFGGYFNGMYIMWKVKGEKHSKSKVKTLKEVDLAKLEKAERIANEITKSWRLEQGLTEIFGLNYNVLDLDVKRLGEYIRWVNNDTIKEELDIIVENELEPKEVIRHISNISRKYFMEKTSPINIVS